ncbi:hypothetical protein C9374_011382 [Naegleria lovaniensis]|uniref:Uncharacterized protein n=1 Tax=Naegleria lovaniensis TaxID=51637 RepID=A0AA88H417_NAELO|nr:uncharacterized protein C9374_011382 [Naegleria lovaniensis]KAG2392657.1 hypothetical protein C9374_011382 [Naegleria lovaniensis]
MRNSLLNRSSIEFENEFVWPDTIGIGNDGYMYFVTNNLCDFVQDFISNWTKPNFFIHRRYIGFNSYTNGCENSHLELGVKEWAVIGTLLAAWLVGLVAILVIVFIMNRRKKKKQGNAYASLPNN